MKAVLLAAGVGSRLRPYTNTMPKCLVLVAGMSPIERAIEWLRRQGIDDLAVNLHSHPDAVVGTLGDGTRLGVSIRYSREATLLGTAGALRPLAEWLARSRFLVVYADNLFELDLHRMFDLHDALDAAVTLALFERPDVSASGVAELDGARVVRFVEKPSEGDTESHWVNAGVLVCEPRVLAFVPPGCADWGHDVLPALVASGETVGGYRMSSDEWLSWIDTPEDLERAERQLVELGASR